MQNILQQVNSTSRTIIKSSITTAQSLHKNQTRIWMHNLGSHHLPKKSHEEARRRPKRCLISNTSNNELEAIESEMTSTPGDLRIDELQRHEAMKLYQNQDLYLSHKIKSYDFNNSNQSPCKQKILKQLLTQIAKHKNCHDINKLQLPSVNPQIFEVFK